MLYELKRSHNAAEATKNNYCAKSVSTFRQSPDTRCFRKFRSSNKNVDVHARSGWSKAMDSRTMLQKIDENPAIST